MFIRNFRKYFLVYKNIKVYPKQTWKYLWKYQHIDLSIKQMHILYYNITYYTIYLFIIFFYLYLALYYVNLYLRLFMDII